MNDRAATTGTPRTPRRRGADDAQAGERPRAFAETRRERFLYGLVALRRLPMDTEELRGKIVDAWRWA